MAKTLFIFIVQVAASLKGHYPNVCLISRLGLQNFYNEIETPMVVGGVNAPSAHFVERAKINFTKTEPLASPPSSAYPEYTGENEDSL